ncbi:restriction endonuclease subunit S [Leptospira meyeri]|uniref:restriction endonuclease subunit S n=1 Tax=Leptospira meyeri TaxID=29508 RepID=UPI0010823701|nr:restriction endonuclease subunit S [Leptospira meyeri]TGM63187.1 restriction endonuclease subunit S [Leptospira meyeri]TGM70288.1 restriction endonuclease subunit S [Leptospira meyeri]
MNEWKECKLEDLAENRKRAIISGPFGSNISSKYFTLNGIPVIRGNNLSLKIGIKFIDKDFVFLSEEKAEELGTWATKDDLIFTAAGTIGQVAILTGKEKYQKYIISNKQLRVTLDKDKILPLFAYYWFASPETKDTIQQSDTGSTIPLINLTVLRSLPILLPPLAEQKAIAGVLSALDDKIDLLHRQNKTLEAMAEALFRQWFVEEAEESWEEVPLSFFGEIVCGKTPSKQVHNYFGGEIPFIKIPDMHGKVYLFETSDSLTVEGKLSQANKTIPPMSICVSCIATVGLVSLNTVESQTNQQINSIVPKESFYRYFLFLTMKSLYDLLNSMASGGTATLNLNTGDFSNILIIYPGKNKLIQFQEEIEPHFKKIYFNTNQIRSLENLRDTLLPKLMSGDVRVEV